MSNIEAAKRMRIIFQIKLTEHIDIFQRLEKVFKNIPLAQLPHI